MKWLVALLSHRWTPFFALTGGSFVLVLLLAFLIPDRIGAETKALPRAGRTASTLSDGSTSPTAARGNYDSGGAPVRQPRPDTDSMATPVPPAGPDAAPGSDD